jgi:hypothetical protein
VAPLLPTDKQNRQEGSHQESVSMLAAISYRLQEHSEPFLVIRLCEGDLTGQDVGELKEVCLEERGYIKMLVKGSADALPHSSKIRGRSRTGRLPVAS